MREPTDDLINRLSADAPAVTPNHPPIIRLLLMALPILAIMALVAAFAGDPRMVMDHMLDPAFALSTLSAVATGLTSIYAALAYSVPGRTNTGTPWVLTSALVWLVSSGVLCTRGMAAHHGSDTSIFASADCFFFSVGVGPWRSIELELNYEDCRYLSLGIFSFQCATEVLVNRFLPALPPARARAQSWEQAL